MGSCRVHSIEGHTIHIRVLSDNLGVVHTMKINDILSNPITLDICVIGWFISMTCGLILEEQFTWFEYSFSFVFGIYLVSRLYNKLTNKEEKPQ